MKKSKNAAPLLPSYSILPLAAVLAVNFLTYNGTRLLTGGLLHHDFSLPIDSALPFIPAFSVIYLLAYVQWVTGFIMAARESREFCYKALSGEIIAELICLVIFLAVPTAIERPEITSAGFFSAVTRFIYQVDTPDNLFPSLHCLESWFCLRCSFKMKSTGRPYRCFSLIFSLLVFASTVFIKQHIVVDIFAGIIVCEAGLLIAEKADAGRVFEMLGSRLSQIKNKFGDHK